MLYDGKEPTPPRIPTVGEKLGELDGWVSSENPYGWSPDCRDHPEGCECVNCSGGDCPGDSYMGR